MKTQDKRFINKEKIIFRQATEKMKQFGVGFASPLQKKIALSLLNLKIGKETLLRLVFFNRDGIDIAKNDGMDWRIIRPRIEKTIKQFLEPETTIFLNKIED